MKDEQSVKSPKKPSKIGFYILMIASLGLLAITLFDGPTPLEELKTKKLVIKEAPRFVVVLSYSGKNRSKTYTRMILFNFENFKNRDKKDELKIVNLQLIDAKGLKEDLKAGDKIEVKYDENDSWIHQISKNSKTYMEPEKVALMIAEGAKYIICLSLILFLTCIIGLVMSNRGVKYAGWKTAIAVAIIIVVFCILPRSQPFSYQEFPEFKNAPII